jgi:hypothetical protein
MRQRPITGRNQSPDNGYALSVLNDDPVLPEGFDPAACKGLAMTTIGED